MTSFRNQKLANPWRGPGMRVHPNFELVNVVRSSRRHFAACIAIVTWMRSEKSSQSYSRQAKGFRLSPPLGQAIASVSPAALIIKLQSNAGQRLGENEHE